MADVTSSDLQAATSIAGVSASAAGLAQTVTAYNPKMDIPADALDAKDFPTVDAWLDACIAQDKPGKIGSGDYDVSGLPRYAPKGIYGYGDTPPKFIAAEKDCWLYLSNQDVTIKGVAFENFGQVLGGAQALQEGTPFHSPTTADFGRFDVNNGHALGLTVAASTSVVGPAVTISDSSFTNCQNVYTFVSDTTQAGKVEFNNNKITGSWGILNINSRLWTEVDATNNEWSNATQPDAKNNGYQTGFFIGTNNYSNDDVNHYTKLNISNNYAHDISSVNTYQNTNAGVFADVRGVNSQNPGDNIIANNDIEHVKGVLGQEDSNVIYAKAWGLTIQGNYIVDGGADYVDAKHNGSETTGVLVKPYYEGIAKDINVIGNTFVDMPTALQNGVVDLSVVKLSEAVGNSSVSYNTFIGGGNTSGTAGSGIIRFYDTFENLSVIGNSFVDANITAGNAAINFHQIVRYGSDTHIEVSNNSGSLSDGSYNGDAQWIKLDGDKTTLSQLVYGHNVLEGGYVMTVSRPGSATAPVRDNPYPPATHGGGEPSGGGDLLSLQNIVSHFAENINVATGIKIADIALTSSAPSSALSLSLSGADAASFVIKDAAGGGHALYYIGASPDFETQSSYAVSVTSHDTLLGAAGDEHQNFTLGVTDVNEAPTAITLVNALGGIGDHDVVGTGIKIADISIVDDGLGTEQLSLSGADAASFSIRDTANGGHALYYTGASPGADIKSGYAVSIDAQDLSLTGSTILHQVVSLTVLASSEPSGGGTPDPVPGLIYGTANGDTLVGGIGNDIFVGGAGADVLIGGAGSDTASYETAAGGVRASLTLPLKNTGDALGDTYLSIENLTGSKFDDALSGTNSSNTLIGGDGNDTISGMGGADSISGGNGNDTLFGNGGNDRIEGGQGDDTLSGGSSGRDWFVYSNKSFGHDTIVDFEKHLDVLDFRGSGLGFADLQVTQQGADVLVSTVDHSSTILIQHTNVGDVGSGDFLF